MRNLVVNKCLRLPHSQICQRTLLPKSSSRLVSNLRQEQSQFVGDSQGKVIQWNQSSTPDTHIRSDWIDTSVLKVPSSHIENDQGETKIIPFLLADIGEGIAEVELLQWYVSKGERIAQFDRVCEVQSDKATVEITSRYDGIVESLCGNTGDMIQVGSALIHIAVANTDFTSKDQVASTRPTPNVFLHNVNDQSDKLQNMNKTDVNKNVSDEELSSTIRNKVLTTPAVRKLGKDHNINLQDVAGTGPKGRILKADVLKILQDVEQVAVHHEIQSLTPTLKETPRVPFCEDETVPIRGYNRLMCKTMTASLQIPHMCYADEIDMSAVLTCRRNLKSIAESRGVKLSLLAFAIKAASLAMTEFRVLNSCLDPEQYTLTYKVDHNIGVAMDTPRGLVVPVIRICQNLSILEIAQELERLKQSALDGNLTENDITGGTFTMSNIGAIGGTYMSPIVSSPQVAIGAMGRIQRLPRFVGNQVEEVNIMQISWGGDHRVIDGATMARFSNKWKDYMESPITMLLSMK